MRVLCLDDVIDFNDAELDRICTGVEAEARRQKAADEVARAIADRQDPRRRRVQARRAGGS